MLWPYSPRKIHRKVRFFAIYLQTTVTQFGKKNSNKNVIYTTLLMLPAYTASIKRPISQNKDENEMS